MILRRFTKHIKEQNWFAVGLDVVVVVVGIFLGMQVTEWNEERKESRLATDYLHRLHEDMTLSIEATNRTKEFIKENTNRLELIIDSLKECELEVENRDKFANGLNHIGKLIPATFVRGTLEELQSSGRIGLLRSPEIRDLLNEVSREIEYQASVWPALHGRSRPPLIYVDEVVMFRSFDGITGFSIALWDDVEIDFKSACKDKKFLAAISVLKALGHTNIDWLDRNINNFSKTRTTIANKLELGK